MAADDDALTIDELARRTGMTARNIRAHQSRGLLPPPELRGRTGYYREEHVRRLETIKELQAQGFNLEAIRRLIADGDALSGEVLRFSRAVRAPFEPAEPRVITVEDLVERWGPAQPDQLARSIELGLLEPLGDGRYEDHAPLLSDAARELVELGVDVAAQLDVVEEIRRHAEGIADTYVKLFLERVWAPFDEAGRPPERWPEVRTALERLRPLAADALASIFGLVMSEAVERAFGDEIGSG